MNRKPILAALLACVVVAGWGLAAAQDAPSTAKPATRDLLDAIREDLVNLRFEKALAAIEALLGEPGMSEAERAEGLVLRAQAHVALGDVDAVEDDYLAILRMRPGYRPEPSLTPAKAMDRYRKVRAKMVGHLRLTVDPADTQLSVDGRVVTTGPDGLLPMLAGEHILRGERAGHDPFQETVNIKAGTEQPLSVQLLPNARTLVMRTEPEGVEVFIDGVSAGHTARPEAGHGTGQPAAELVIANVPLGDHTFDLKKECFRTERLKDVVTVDLLNREPKVYRTVQMAPAAATLSADGIPTGAPIFVDGKQAGRLPLEAFAVCPGTRRIAVRLVGRTVWQADTEFIEGEETRLRIEPRPNAALVGAEEWPPALKDLGSQFSTVAMVPLPSGADLTTPDGWAHAALPESTDIALLVLPPEREGAADQWFLYSPLLGKVERLDVAPSKTVRPTWTETSWGLTVVDSRLAGYALVVGVDPAGPAASAGIAPGDSIVAVGGREVSDAATVRQTLGVTVGGRPVELRWRSPDGEQHTAEIQGLASPRLGVEPESLDRAMVRAGWALVDALSDPDQEPAALANLALLFGAHGHHDLAVETWRRVRWPDRVGIGEGTRQYYLGRELELLGREEEAIQAYRLAAASDATTFRDEGPPVAPAARDRLADLGVSVSAP
jgi:hypothetical protein